MPVSFAFAYAHPLHSIIDRGEYEKYRFLFLYRNAENPLKTERTPWIDWTQWKGSYTSFSVLSTERFKQKDSMLNTAAVIAVTKSSMKPRSGATVNHHLRSSGERNGEQR